MANKMNEVAKLLGVELEEEFRINVSPLEFKLTTSGLLYWSNASQMWERSRSIEELLIGQYEIIKIPKPILDEKEKKYLSAVIKPFRNRVINIKKESGYSIECIKITLNPLKVMTADDIVYLPNFIKLSMYKGMETDKAYTTDELGI